MSVTILRGDCRDVLKTLPAESVQCCVTSPPYFGLRDYGTGSWEGGDEDCDHRKVADAVAAVSGSTLGRGKKTTGHVQEGFKASCGRCGAIREDSQIGLEQTPAEYVAAMVDVFRQVRRVLRKDGVAWLNLGDSYAGSMKGYMGNGTWADRSQVKQGTNVGALNIMPTKAREMGLKNKDLMMIPARVAIALCDDGWYLRQDIIWSKSAPMPESVTDRCTRSHEYVFLLAKSERYYFDAEAIAEPVVSGANGSSFLTGKTGINGGGRNSQAERVEKETRNKRSVWHLGPEPLGMAHFAVMPTKLVEPCILAGSRVGDTVLDPFAGSGTVLRVATKHRRKSIGIELNPAYVDLIERRTSRVQQTLPMEDAS